MGAIANSVINQSNKITTLEEYSVHNFDLNPLDMSGRLLYISSETVVHIICLKLYPRYSDFHQNNFLSNAWRTFCRILIALD